MSEARITINGVTLTDAESTTLRVALGSFIIDLTGDGLGDDEHGRKMTELYLAHCRKIERLLIQPKG